ncbi:tetratricopeptide repeat protein [Flavobacterium aquatile]|uniref:Tetratricopeptide repeat protein n=1 Tax=Flavobacterium aquatile LMG 4008 = ATCC 11947 TaxID=1453498 RepID=A0A095V432_9FLAO|nr:tetratricopeptide repeat protein [Flavobacterium aquatile]KGD69600.1 hypothetical protein LG45_02255 [Flavobacterium aquatile LMG 4008 = ATCC 11947]OXA67261.1 hypothetical protein B0A61_08625 [Flavobacterium aquatile LMG 4008 = ATCC 11947]GEC77919.1 hypothetical protein FAQ01_07890 [Flavobacterium aquatile]
MITKFTLIFMSLLFLNCNDKKSINPIPNNVVRSATENPDCKKFFKKYNEKYVQEESDSALVYLDKAIDCDPENNNYKFTKAKFLTEIKRFDDAIKTINVLVSASDDPAFKLFKGIVMLKMKDNDSDKFLDSVYKDFYKIKDPTSGNEFYRVSLDNYFKGKEFSLNEIAELKVKYKDKGYETQNFTAIEELIKKENRETVLFKLFNIN